MSKNLDDALHNSSVILYSLVMLFSFGMSNGFGDIAYRKHYFVAYLVGAIFALLFSPSRGKIGFLLLPYFVAFLFLHFFQYVNF